jgi:hypothetical protein
MSNVWHAPSEKGALSVFPGFIAEAFTWGGTAPTKVKQITYVEESDSTDHIFFQTEVSGGTNTLHHYSSTTTEVVTGMHTNSGKLGMATYEDISYFFPEGGSTLPFYVKLSDLSTDTMGLTQPSVAGVSKVVTPGTPSDVRGVVRYYICFVDATTGAIGPLSVAFGEHDMANGADTIGFTGLPTSGTDTRIIYRTFANKFEPLLLDRLDATTTTYTDTKADALLGTPPQLHGEAPPAGVKYPIIHANRMWAAVGSRVYFTDRNNMQSWFSEFYYSVEEDDGDTITAIARDPSGLLVFKGHHIYKIVVKDPQTEEAIISELTLADPSVQTIGCTNKHTMVTTDKGSLVWFYDGNVYKMDPSDAPKRISDDIDTEMKAFTATEEAGLHAAFWPEYRLYVITSASQNASWGYSLDEEGWFHLDCGFEAITRVHTEGARQVWGAYSQDPTKVHQLGVGTATTYAGDGFTATISIPPTYLQRPGNLSLIQGALLTYKAMAKSWTVDWYIDTANTAGSKVLDCTRPAGIDRWTAYFGVNRRGSEILWSFTHTVADAAAADGLFPTLYAFNLDMKNLGTARRG